MFLTSCVAQPSDSCSWLSGRQFFVKQLKIIKRAGLCGTHPKSLFNVRILQDSGRYVK
jgi:hypothetical protein